MDDGNTRSAIRIVGFTEVVRIFAQMGHYFTQPAERRPVARVLASITGDTEITQIWCIVGLRRMNGLEEPFALEESQHSYAVANKVKVRNNETTGAETNNDNKASEVNHGCVDEPTNYFQLVSS